MRFMLATAAVLALGLSAPASASLQIIKKARCNACHALDKKMVGPSFRDIGAKYVGQADAPAALFAKVREGGAGNWGQIPMMPNDPDKIGDDDLKSAITWILDGAK